MVDKNKLVVISPKQSTVKFEGENVVSSKKACLALDKAIDKEFEVVYSF